MWTTLSKFYIFKNFFEIKCWFFISLGAQQTQKVPDIQLVQSNLTNIAAQNVNKAFVYISDCNLPLKSV